MTSADTVASANGTATANTVAPVAAGTTLWLTGLPSAGKTTLALALAGVLRERGVDVEVLDGDEVRTHLSAGLGFSRQDRQTQVTRIGYVAELLAKHGVIVIVPVIAPYQDAREKVRAHHESHGTAILQVHLSTPLEVCADRDVKGLYAKAFRGEISAMTGVDDPYEIPVDPDLRIDTSTLDLQTSVAALLGLLLERGRL
ncbi:MAG TPA: adenylyl-sulfate kinase [Nakamurella sp.]|nr:adenylyl-sulfate kinase [Nakamurella sp.]